MELPTGLATDWRGDGRKPYLKPGTSCVRLDGVDPERFMAGGCSLPTALHAVELAQVSFGATVLVLGSGPVDLSAIICADLRGAHRVLCIGAPETRLQIASRVGAHGTLDFSKHTRAARIEWVHALTHGRGADITIEATGNPETVVDSMRYTRDAGRVIVVGQYTNVGEHPLVRILILIKNTWKCSAAGGCEFSYVHRAAQLLSEPSRSSRWSPIPLQRYGLTQTESALDEVAKGCAHKAFD